MMNTLPAWTKSLEHLLGPAHVITDAATLDANAAQDVRPACLCAPANAAEIAAVIRFAAENKIPVLPRGGGTAQGIGSPPPPSALVLSTKRLNRLIHHEPGDMVATAEAGMTLGDFQNALAQNGQWLPLDGDPRATLGGLIATDRSGPRALGYGTLRDMVLGMSVVNGDGVIRKCGGKVVKNVTGYDLAKLYIGSLGTLGVVTEVTFKLRPLPIERNNWGVAEVPSVAKGVEILSMIMQKNLPLESMRFVSRIPVDLSDNISGALVLFINAAGTTAELDRIHTEVVSATSPLVAYRSPVETSASHHGLGNGYIPNDSNLRATLRFSCLASNLLEVFKTALTSFSTIGPISVNLNGGIIEFAEITTERVEKLSASLSKLGVNYRFENIQGLKIPEPYGPPRPEWSLMKQIRHALDPRGILNPGRFVV